MIVVHPLKDERSEDEPGVARTRRTVLVLSCPSREIRVTLAGNAQQTQGQRYPFLSVCTVFPCVQTKPWLGEEEEEEEDDDDDDDDEEEEEEEEEELRTLLHKD